jgi:hypothetical protein
VRKINLIYPIPGVVTLEALDKDDVLQIGLEESERFGR